MNTVALQVTALWCKITSSSSLNFDLLIYFYKWTWSDFSVFKAVTCVHPCKHHFDRTSQRLTKSETPAKIVHCQIRTSQK